MGRLLWLWRWCGRARMKGGCGKVLGRRMRGDGGRVRIWVEEGVGGFLVLDVGEERRVRVRGRGRGRGHGHAG